VNPLQTFSSFKRFGLLGLLRTKRVASIKAHPQLAELDKKTTDELEKVKRLDPEKPRIAVCGSMHGNG
jgi:hypothetical protein